MYRVVHIVAHLGGGVGKILSSLTNYHGNRYKHIIITLEETKSSKYLELCYEKGVEVQLINQCNIEKIISDADIIQIDWWHHPLVSKFMYDYLDKIEARLLIWSHISGCSYPVINNNLILYPDYFLFSTPYSYENSSWTAQERDNIKQMTSVVVSSGIDDNDMSRLIENKQHRKFNIGYVGFLGYNKTHPRFIEFCESGAWIPGCHYTIVGDTKYGEELVNDMKNSKLLEGKYHFTGFISDVRVQLNKFDVFGYPLNPEHYGTAENVLLEAMAAGVVPVVLNQCIEKYMVKHMETGLVVNNIEEYGQALEWLYKNPIERKKMGENARRYIKTNYKIKHTVNKLEAIYDSLMELDKSLHNYNNTMGSTPYEWFKSCYNGDINNIQGNAFVQTKGSAIHYLKYFPDDYMLQQIVKNNSSKS